MGIPAPHLPLLFEVLGTSLGSKIKPPRLGSPKGRASRALWGVGSHPKGPRPSVKAGALPQHPHTDHGRSSRWAAAGSQGGRGSSSCPGCSCTGAGIGSASGTHQGLWVRWVKASREVSGPSSAQCPAVLQATCKALVWCTLTSAGAIPPDEARGAGGTPGTCSLCHTTQGELSVEGLYPWGITWPQPVQGSVLGRAACCGPSICPCCATLSTWQQGPARGAQALVGAPQVAALEGTGWRKEQALVHVWRKGVGRFRTGQ